MRILQLWSAYIGSCHMLPPPTRQEETDKIPMCVQYNTHTFRILSNFQEKFI